MSANSSVFDTSKELLIQRYRNGIQLLKPESSCLQECNSITNIYNSSINAYFYNSQSQFISVNSACIENIGAQSSKDICGKNVGRFVHDKFEFQLVKNNGQVMRSAKYTIFEEIGNLSDGLDIHLMSFKFPWYYENKIIGVFGCSLTYELSSLGYLANALTLLIETGLLTPVHMVQGMIANKTNAQAFNQTNRENLLPHLAEGNEHRKYMPHFGGKLSAREVECLQRMAKGLSAKAIAEELSLSSRTIETYVESAKSKLGCLNKTELIIAAIKYKYIDIE